MLADEYERGKQVTFRQPLHYVLASQLSVLDAGRSVQASLLDPRTEPPSTKSTRRRPGLTPKRGQCRIDGCPPAHPELSASQEGLCCGAECTS